MREDFQEIKLLDFFPATRDLSMPQRALPANGLWPRNEAKRDFTVGAATPAGNVPLSVQEAMKESLTAEDKALLAFFGAPGFKDRMSQSEALGLLHHRVRPPWCRVRGALINSFVSGDRFR